MPNVFGEIFTSFVINATEATTSFGEAQAKDKHKERYLDDSESIVYPDASAT